MKTLPQISEAEFEVMKIVWKYAPISTKEITEKLLPITSWSPKTIQDSNQAPCNQRCPYLLKRKPYVYLYSHSERE